MAPLRKSPHRMFSGHLRKPSAKTPTRFEELESPRHQQYKLIAATATAVLLIVAMAANCYMAVTSQSVFQNPPWDQTASLMFASFGELACSMTLVTILATINPEFLWGVMAGLIGIAIFVVVAILNGVGGAATAVFFGYSIFWSAFVVELRLKWCPLLIQCLSIKLGVDSPSTHLELPTSCVRHPSFDDCETLYSPTTPSAESFTININDKLAMTEK